MIVQAPNEVLSSKAAEVKKINPETLRIIEDMKHALLNVKDIIGVGLAAPQIGVSLRIFIMKPNQKAQIQTVINPKVVWRPDDKIVYRRKNKKPASPAGGQGRGQKRQLEGCLSLKDIWGTVLRSPRIKISYLDEKGKEHETLFTGFKAIIVQHEMDHLEGILFPKRVLEQKGKLYQSHKNENGEDEFDALEI